MTTNLTPAFAPTLMQQLLGRNYKWLVMINYEVKMQTTYLTDNIAWIFGQLVIILPIIWIWVLNKPEDLNTLITYFLIGNIGLSLIENTLSYRIAYEIETGRITKFLLLPSNYLTLIFFRGIGRNSVANISAIFMIGLVCLFYSSNLIFSSWANLILWFLVLIFGYFIKAFLEMIIAFMAFWFVDIGNFIFLFRNMFLFLSGSLIPFYLLNNGLSQVQYNPLAFTFYHPMQIYLGKYSPLETLWVFVGGFAWCVVLYFFAKLVFRMGLKRNESVGL